MLLTEWLTSRQLRIPFLDKLPQALSPTSQHHLFWRNTDFHTHKKNNTFQKHLWWWAGGTVDAIEPFPFFPTFMSPWRYPRCPLSEAAATDTTPRGRDKGKKCLKPSANLSAVSLQLHWKRASMQVITWGALVTQSWARGFHFPAQLASPWGNACWSHVAVSDTLLRSLASFCTAGSRAAASLPQLKRTKASRDWKIMSASSLPPPSSPVPPPFLWQVENHPKASPTAGLYLFISLRRWWRCCPSFSEGKMLWQPRMKVFVLILPSRQEPLQKKACRSLRRCRGCCCGGRDKQPISAELKRNIEKGMRVV